MALAQVVAGARIVTSDANQYYNILKGVSGSGETITLIYNAAASLIFQPSSDPSAGTEAVQVKNNAGTVQGSVTFDGKFKASDGTAALPSLRMQSEATGLYLSAAGVIGVSTSGVSRATISSTTATFAGLMIVSGASISVGTNPSTTGVVKLPNNSGGLRIRNNGNTDNWNVIDVDNTDTLVIGQSSLPVSIPGTATLTVGGTGKIIAAGTLTAGGLLGSAVQIATSGPLIYSGSGAPSISAAVKGSLYLRSDGTGTGDRIYVAKDTAGAWAALTAAS